MVPVQKGLGGHNHPWGTEATLDRPPVDEGLLERMEPAIAGQSLYGLHLLAFGSQGRVDTGSHRLAIDDHRAGAASIVSTAVLGPGEV